MMKIFKFLGVGLLVLVFFRACFEFDPIDLNYVLYHFQQYNFSFSSAYEILTDLENYAKFSNWFYYWDSDIGVLENIFNMISHPVLVTFNVFGRLFDLLVYFIGSFLGVIKLIWSVLGFPVSSPFPS